MAKRGVRDQMVIATKYTTPWRTGFGDREIIVNTGGNGTKSLRGSLAASLKNLQTDYVDLVSLLIDHFPNPMLYFLFVSY
jgi:aryl-alcohol dehydrogenase-like predicted oxidoreductase